MGTRRIALSGLVLLEALLAAPAAADDFFYLVEAEELACIVANLEAYLASGSDPVLVVPGDCPPSGETDLAGLLTNEAPNLTSQRRARSIRCWCFRRRRSGAWRKRRCRPARSCVSIPISAGSRPTEARACPEASGSTSA